MKQIIIISLSILTTLTSIKGQSAKTVALPTNVQLEYVEQGKTKGVPLILLHGFTDSWYSFSQVLPFLPGDLHVYAISMRGHGNSSRPEKGYRPQDFAADIAAFIKTMHTGPAIIVGHSFGSLVAQQLAIDHPNLLQGLVLIGTFANVSTNPVLTQMKEVMTNLHDPIDNKFVEEFQKSTLAQPVPDLFINTIIQESMKVPARVWAQGVEGFLPVNNTAALKKFKKPTLILWGGKDQLCPRADQLTLNHLIKGSQLFEYELAGHGLHWEEPKRFAFDLIAFSHIVKNNK